MLGFGLLLKAIVSNEMTKRQHQTTVFVRPTEYLKLAGFVIDSSQRHLLEQTGT
jgi:hypothetical protein